MSIRFRKSAGIAAILATTTLALPAQAANISSIGHGAVGHWNTADDIAHGWRSRGGWGGYYGGGWGGYGRVRGGDVLAGILIVGGALAVVKAIENLNDRRYRERDYPNRDYRDRAYRDGDYRDGDYRDGDYRDDDQRYRDYRDRDGDYRGSGENDGRDYRAPIEGRYDDDARRGVNGAIEDCVGEVQRDSRVATVDTAERDGDGWHVSGDLARGGRYSCKFGNDGRVRDIDIDMGRASPRDEISQETRRDERYDDEYYASARARIGDRGPEVRSSEVAPPAEEPEMAAPADDGSRTWQRGEADDRYETASAGGYALAGK